MAPRRKIETLTPPCHSVTKRDLAMRIAAKQEISPEKALEILQQILDEITADLARKRHIEFRDFGVFEVIRRRARIGRNPNQPDHSVVIPERQVVKFKPGKRLRTLITEG